MKSIFKQFTKTATAFLFFVSLATYAADIPDPEVLAKQYLKDLCTLNEQDFTRKYMLTQADAAYVISEIAVSYKKMNKTPSEKLSDSLGIRSEVHKMVVASYRSFKEWQHENNIDSSKVSYYSSEFELEKRREIPFCAIDDMNIFFTVDTLYFVMSCEEFIFLSTKWVGGESGRIYSADNYFNQNYDYDEDYAYEAVDSAYAVEEYDYAEYAVEAYDYAEAVTDYSKKDLKIQKKIDAYNRKIDALYMKQYE